ADDVVRIDVLPRVLADLVVADRLQIVLRQEVEPKLLGLGRGVHPDGYGDEPEGDRAAPDRSWHESEVPGFQRRRTRQDRASEEGAYPPKSFSTQRGVDSWGRHC